MQATATAHSNIALIKYWGKRDERLILPANSSLSLTVDRLSTTTTVSFDPDLAEDRLILNQKSADEKSMARVSRFLDRTRFLTNTNQHATVISRNVVPTAAGLASSASGFAALAAAASRALGLQLDEPTLSRLARQGSGSACRSVFGGFVEWQKGKRRDGMDSYAVPVASQSHWDLVMLITVVSNQRKPLSSREGMRRSIETSPFYSGWLETVENDLIEAKEAIASRDFEKLGRVVEANALKMHAVMLGAEPPFTYWWEPTLSVMKKVWEMREAGIPAYFTMDAGPNVIVLCERENVAKLQQGLLHIRGVTDVVECHPGPGITYEKEGMQP